MKKSPTFGQSILELIDVLSASNALEEQVKRAGDAILQSLQQGCKLLTCGNGGSAADALHLAEELVGRYKMERRGLPAICFNADVTAITCIGNDYGYDHIFERQVEALGKPGDVLVGFTTSGNSPNIISAFNRAKAAGIITIFLGGKDGGAAKGLCDHEIIIPSFTTARIQEVHTVILHQWLEEIDITDWNNIKI
ncbi:phosphoheptose isomerase [Mucilaginibacter gracilis]|uniref:Phosphoheptose isomerase n=1 Tax=Mucilaginibacter gracilis TaxID=423350 RepID=A0A495IZV6_9SPHI|nr:SIS domain-containing protein [Mucilaginibacter gracilis]RKR82256.1 phosphoheptose isomerase [Mucilaginibacter gracilis]